MNALLPLQILNNSRTADQANKVLAVMSDFLAVDTLFVALNDGLTNVMLATRNGVHLLAHPASATPLADAYCRVVVEDRSYVEIPNTADNPRTTASAPTRQYGPATFVGVPLALQDGRIVGTLCGWDTEPFQLTPPQRHLLESMGDFLSYVFELEWQSYWDPLTAVGNRRLMDWVLDAPNAASQQKSVVFCDMDNLKPLNETWGHAVGDRAIRVLADRLQRIFSPEGNEPLRRRRIRDSPPRDERRGRPGSSPRSPGRGPTSGSPRCRGGHYERDLGGGVDQRSHDKLAGVNPPR